MRRARIGRGVVATVLATAGVLAAGLPGGAAPVTVSTDAELTAAWTDPTVTEIVVGSDIELECGAGVRPQAAAPLVLDGAGRTVTDTCTSSEFTLAASAGVTIRDLRLVGREGIAQVNYVVQASFAALRLERSTVVSRAPGGVALSIGDGSQIVGSDVVAEGDESEAVRTRGSLVVDGSSLSGRLVGLSTVDDGDLVVRDSSVTSAGLALVTANPARIERTALRGDDGALIVSERTTSITSSTLVTAPQTWPTDGAARGPLRVGGSGRVSVALSTISSEGGDPTGNPGAIWGAAGSEVDLVGSVLAAAEGDAVCAGDVVVTSGGANVASDGSCGLAGAGDLVADPGLPPVDPATGYAVPEQGSPVLDHVPLALCESTSDQRGILRPQGPACDAGAYELAVLDETPLPGSSSTLPGDGTPPGVAPPATPIVGPARFTG